MIRSLAPFVFVGMLLIGGCSQGADELLSTAQLEEKQDNPDNARRLYEQIVRDHPGSPQAATARERLAALAERGEHQ
ncbi:MAG TPA: tetratricopeptide repeat protein [Candidatus Limnocylindrales bacterium]|nr:tetratricopeptide repeat protein [Candidatus Limnocylindrales bacterium]